jgi:hypothetical protein
VSVAARASALAALALVGGVGTVYAPVPTFTDVAARCLGNCREGLENATRACLQIITRS